MRRSITLALLARSLQFANGSPPARAEAAANDDAVVVSAISGGGDVRKTHTGYTVQRRDGQQVRWVRSYDGYSAMIDGSPARISRTYDGLSVIGADASSVARTYDGFIVRSDRGPSVRWMRAADSYVGTVNGKSIRLSQSYDGFRSSEHPTATLALPQARPNSVKRMPLSKPSSFRRWPAAAEQ